MAWEFGRPSEGLQVQVFSQLPPGNFAINTIRKMQEQYKDPIYENTRAVRYHG